MTTSYYTTKQVAQQANIHRDTLLRWFREGRISEPKKRDRNGWRLFTIEEAQAISTYAQSENNNDAEKVLHDHIASYEITQPNYNLNFESIPYFDVPKHLATMSWDFHFAQTGYLTHSFHPYPCKFIPQIPNTLIQELSSVGETILDPFCGSGTTLVEALRLRRSAIGIDANPLACILSRAKTSRADENTCKQLQSLADEIGGISIALSGTNGMQPLFPEFSQLEPKNLPTDKGITEWFEPQVIKELAVIKEKCLSLPDKTSQIIALASFSSIIVSVSYQDSETRYVRREKNIQPGDVYRKFTSALKQNLTKSIEFSEEVDPLFKTQVYQSDILATPDIGLVDLVVCSPPYPNAFSYHLYHRTRMQWLDMDQPSFKRQEIGSHRKYSSKGKSAATADTFKQELRLILSWLANHLRSNRHACFVIGDSTIQGQTIYNDQLLIEVAKEAGFQLEANINRRLQDTKKSFNPSIGKIRDEHIVILRNQG